jgi:hypothetical protein
MKGCRDSFYVIRSFLEQLEDIQKIMKIDFGGILLIVFAWKLQCIQVFLVTQAN